MFCYAGGLYRGERDCSPLFKAVRELIDEGMMSATDVRFDYAGPDGSVIRAQAEPYSLAEIITDNGIIPRSQAMAIQQASDCVVVATFCYAEGGGAMTGKVYEPIMMRKPIMMLVSGEGRNSEPAAFVEYLNAGYVYEQSASGFDVTGIKEAILAMLVEKRETGLVASKINESRRNEYSYERIARRLTELIESL